MQQNQSRSRFVGGPGRSVVVKAPQVVAVATAPQPALEKPRLSPRLATCQAEASRVREALRLVNRLTPYHGDPERFFMCRAEAVAVLEAIARSLEATP